MCTCCRSDVVCSLFVVVVVCFAFVFLILADYFGLFDGHGGDETAHYVGEELQATIYKVTNFGLVLNLKIIFFFFFFLFFCSILKKACQPAAMIQSSTLHWRWKSQSWCDKH